MESKFHSRKKPTAVVGEERRLESIAKRQKEERQRQQIIAKSLIATTSQKATKIIFDDVPKQRPPPFRRYDPYNPMHVKWIKSLQEECTAIDRAEDYTDSKSSLRINPREKDNDNKDEKLLTDKSDEIPHFSMDSTFAEELRNKIRNKSHATDEKPFSFLRMLGRGQTTINNGRQLTIDINLNKSSNNDVECNNQLNNKPVNKQLMNDQNQLMEKGNISLYKKPIDDNPHKCFFFLNEHSPEIRSAMASFRRHVTQEKLRENWQKQREPMVKFYKRERKSTLKRIRKKQLQRTEQHSGFKL